MTQARGNNTRSPSRRISVAPMMDYTDRFCRYFHRLISRDTLLYTEMVTTGALLHGDRSRFLAHDPVEHPLAFQVGGSEPSALARCASHVADAGFDEINLNCGCPSDRVQTGNFGACLMKDSRLVADCVDAMKNACDIDVTVKHRLGVDDLDSYDYVRDFIGTVSNQGCRTFIVHARKAWLQGLSPKENRTIPPLNYDWVYCLKRDFPHLEIIVNGGVATLDEADCHLRHLDGVMIGREAYHNPYLLADVDRRFFAAKTAARTREAILEDFSRFAAVQVDNGVYLKHMSRHILGLYAGQPGGRKFRRFISENAHTGMSARQFFPEALASMSVNNEPCRYLERVS